MVSREAYQQIPDQHSDVVGHAGSLGVTGCQLYQGYQEVLALLHTFQSLLSMEHNLFTTFTPIRDKTGRTDGRCPLTIAGQSPTTIDIHQ